MRPPLIFLDTGPLKALLDTRDQFHQRSRHMFALATASRARLRTPVPALLELHRLLIQRRQSPHDTAAAAHRALAALVEAYPPEHTVETDMSHALESLARFPDQKITLADASIASMALRLGALVMTLDERHFRLLGARTFSA